MSKKDLTAKKSLAEEAMGYYTMKKPRRQSELLIYSSSAIRAKIEGGVDVTSAFRTVVSVAEYLVKP